MRPNAHVISEVVLTFLLSTAALAAGVGADHRSARRPADHAPPHQRRCDRPHQRSGIDVGMPDRSQVWMRASPDTKGDYSSGSSRSTRPDVDPKTFLRLASSATPVLSSSAANTAGSGYGELDPHRRGIRPRHRHLAAHRATPGTAVWRRSHHAARRRSHSRRIAVYPQYLDLSLSHRHLGAEPHPKSLR